MTSASSVRLGTCLLRGELRNRQRPQSAGWTRAHDDVECDSICTGATLPRASSSASAQAAAPGTTSCRLVTRNRVDRELKECRIGASTPTRRAARTTGATGRVLLMQCEYDERPN
jgi:hypothetical protein